MSTRSRLSRRQLLRQGLGAVGAAVAAPTVVPAAALGRDGTTPPSERITMGFIGLGGQGRGHLLGGAWTYITGGYVAREDVQVLAVCDVFRSRREEARQRVDEHYAAKRAVGSYRACQAYNDFREVLARDDIDAVLIATPIHWHGVMSVMAARAGKDIYCEKPTAITIQEARAVAEAVRRYGRVYQGGTQQRSEYDGRFRRAAELVRNGRIGKVHTVYAHCRPGGFSWLAGRGPEQPVPGDLDWDLWLGPAPRMPFDGNAGGHRFCTGGINWGQHHYDIIQWALGADGTGPVEIGMEGPVVRFRYANGVTVYGCGYPGQGVSPGAARWPSLGGEHLVMPEAAIGMNGGARFVGTGGWIAVDRDHLIAEPAHILQEPLGPKDVCLYYSDSHSGNFLECVRTRRKPIVDAEIARRSATVVLLGGIAEELRRTLKWDAQAERFVGDEEANRLLAAAYRPPWTL